jgi:hypothetical protein
MTKIAQILEIVKTEFPLPRKEMIAKIVEATGATPGSANSFYYYAVKQLGLKTEKAPKAPKALKVAKAPKVRTTAIIKVTKKELAEAVRPFEGAAAKFLAWRERQVEFAEPEVAEFEPTSEWEVSESEEARELLRIMAG